MSDALPNNAKDPHAPEPEARSPVSPPVQGFAPAWEDPTRHVPTVEPSLPEAPSSETPASSTRRGFTLQRGGRNSMTDTAERIGSAVGSAQRQVRRKLELVRRPPASPPYSSAVTDTVERANQLAEEAAKRSSLMAQQLEDEVAEFRMQAAERLDEWSEVAGERLQQLRAEFRTALSRLRERAQQFADAYPLQTIAAIAAACFALGVALRIRRSHRG